MRQAATESGSLFLLLAQRIDRTHGLGRQSVEQVRGLGHRSLDVAGEFREQLRAGLEICQLLGTFGIVDGAVCGARPLMTRALLSLAKSRMTFAASMKSPFTKVMAVGPERISSRPSMPASLAAMRASVFFATGVGSIAA